VQSVAFCYFFSSNSASTGASVAVWKASPSGWRVLIAGSAVFSAGQAAAPAVTAAAAAAASAPTPLRPLGRSLAPSGALGPATALDGLAGVQAAYNSNSAATMAAAFLSGAGLEPVLLASSGPPYVGLPAITELYSSLFQQGPTQCVQGLSTVVPFTYGDPFLVATGQFVVTQATGGAPLAGFLVVVFGADPATGNAKPLYIYSNPLQSGQ
jgi:hypothetical protein